MLDITVPVVQAVGAVATAASLIWAIWVYKTAQQKEAFLQARQTMDSLRRKVRELDGMLSQPEFILVGQCIADRLRKLKPSDWTFQQFAEFLSDKENHDSIVQAIHLGRLDSGFIDRLKRLIEDIQQSTTPLKQELPVLAMAMDKTLFYICQTGRLILSPQVFDMFLGDPKAIEKHLCAKSDTIKTEEQFFSRLAFLIMACPQTVLSMNVGQALFDEAEMVLHVLIDTFAALTDVQLRQTSKLQKSNHAKAKAINKKHAIEDAVDMLQITRNQFDAAMWDRIVECKARIVTLMEKKGEQEDANNA